MRILSIFFVLLLFQYPTILNSNSLKDLPEPAKKKIRELISTMTLEEKVGQMTQIALAALSKQPRKESERLVLDTLKLKEAIIKYHIGSILNCGGAANTLEDWHEIITTIQDIATKETRLGIPVIYGIDAIHGANYTIGATLFPQAIAMAATRNTELMKKAGEITALEVRASGIPWNFNPVLGVGREPLWPRFWETFGEDTYLVSQFGKAYIKGLQGNDIGANNKVAACMKHYMGYSVPKNGLDRTPAWIPERMLREIFLPPFEEAVKQGCQTVMINSSEINGIPVHSNKYIIDGILKKELGFKGFAVSDWEDIIRLHTRDKIASTPKEAVRIAVMAGLDMSMVPMDFSFYNYLVELVKEGSVPMSRINDAVYRILRVKYMLGLFDNPYPHKELAKDFASAKSAEINLEAAREAITLLKNKNSSLPLNKLSNVLVTGPTANLLSTLNGGWTITWQGNNESLYPKDKLTILEAVKKKIGNERVSYAEGVDFKGNVNIDTTLALAKNADAVILCLGEHTYTETPGNIHNLELQKEQLELAKKLYKTGKPVILVLTEGRPRIIDEIVDGASAIVMAYLPGMEGGRAIADVLFGDVNPSGKLPFSYPKFLNGNTTYDYKPMENFAPNKVEFQWPFGFGLSYTKFTYSNLKLSSQKIYAHDTLTVSVDVTNTGKLPGKEVVELYLSDLYASVSRPNKQLKRFTKINLQPGETKNVAFKLTNSDLSFIGRNNKRTVEPGKFTVIIKNIKKTFELQ